MSVLLIFALKFLRLSEIILRLGRDLENGLFKIWGNIKWGVYVEKWGAQDLARLFWIRGCSFIWSLRDRWTLSVYFAGLTPVSQSSILLKRVLLQLLNFSSNHFISRPAKKKLGVFLRSLSATID